MKKVNWSNQKEKPKKKIRRQDRFHRVKNKQEQVYKSPAFLSKNLGVSRISESGIFEVKNCYTKAYPITGFSEERWKELLNRWKMSELPGAECVMLQNKNLGERYLLLREECCDMAEAIEKFAETEQYLSLAGLSAEQRLEGYVKHMSKILGEPYLADRYLLETPVWKAAVVMDKLKMDFREFATDTGCFAVMAIRRFPEKITEGVLQKLEEKDYVMASYLSVLKVSDKRVRQVTEGEYLGMDGVLPRMKRKSPLLYDILKKDESNFVETGSFISASAYFLLYAETIEELGQNLCDFSNTAGECGIGMRTEEIPLTELKETKETKEMLAMFGLMGCGQNRYGSFVPADAITKILVPANQKKEMEGQEYDVEKMRALFFGGDGRREEDRNE